jgi:hypothetical protein
VSQPAGAYGFPARHGPDLPGSGAHEPQQRQLATAAEPDHNQRVEDGDRREGEDHRDEERPEPVVQFAVGVGGDGERGAVANAESGIPLSPSPPRAADQALICTDPGPAETAGPGSS